MLSRLWLSLGPWAIMHVELHLPPCSCFMLLRLGRLIGHVVLVFSFCPRFYFRGG